MNLLRLENEKVFEELCQALLKEDLERFQAYSAPDWGMDGYDPDTHTIYQAYFPEKEPRREKIREDIEKAKRHGGACRRWVLLLPKNPTPALVKWLEESEQLCPFSIEVWGKTEIHALLRRHEAVKEQFFPSELQRVVARIAKGRKPAVGDAAAGQEVSRQEAEELREIIEKLAKDEASRKKRSVKDMDFRREYGEFNAHFQLSYYGRLPRDKMSEARRYLNDKSYARQRREPAKLQRNRMVGGIKHIAKALALGDSRYRQILIDLTGKRSTTEMNPKELKKVFDHFRSMQQQADLQIAE